MTHDASPTTQASEAVSLNDGLSRKNSTPVGPIAGGVLGGVAAIALALLLFILLRRKRQAKENRRATLPPPYVDADMSEELGDLFLLAYIY